MKNFLKDHSTLLAIVLVTIWPFIYLLAYVWPINGSYQVIGNDFFFLYYVYKPYFLDLINNSHFPLWSPSEGSGFPFYANPFAQTFYPLNLPLILYYRVFGGYTMLDHQRFTVLGISIFSLGLLLWLRTLKINLRPALFATLTMAVSFRITEIIRFPNAVHSACWYPWILYAITNIISASSKKQTIGNGFILAFSGFCLMTGGYPYYLYYSLFLIAPYGILILIPALQSKLFCIKVHNLGRALLALSVAFIFSSATAAPYLLHISKLMAQTTDRGGKDFEYSTAHLFNLEDTLGSLVYPPASQIEGWYFFGITGVLLLAIFFFSDKGAITNSITSVGLANPPPERTIMARILLASWFFGASYITYGRESHLFSLLWRYFPGFSDLRVWGRMNIILVPLIAWGLALAYSYFEEIAFPLSKTPTPSMVRARRRSVLVLVVTYAAILGIQLSYWSNKVYDYYWMAYFIKNISSLLSASPYASMGIKIPEPEQLTDLFSITFILNGLMAWGLLVFFLYRSKPGNSYQKNLAFFDLLVLTTVSTIIVGPWAWTSGRDIPPGHVRLNISQTYLDSFNTPRIDTSPTIALNSAYNVGIIENWYYERYVDFRKSAQNEPQAFDSLMGMVNGQKIYFSQSITPKTIQEYLKDASRFNVINVKYYDGDTLRLNVNAPSDGFVSFIDNWEPGWTATVDSKPVEIEKLFGTFKSVYVPDGQHTVIFTYCPPIFSFLNRECR